MCWAFLEEPRLSGARSLHLRAFSQALNLSLKGELLVALLYAEMAVIKTFYFGFDLVHPTRKQFRI